LKSAIRSEGIIFTNELRVVSLGIVFPSRSFGNFPRWGRKDDSTIFIHYCLVWFLHWHI